MKRFAPAFALAAGLVCAASLLLGIIVATKPAVHAEDDWRPSCVRALDTRLQAIDVSTRVAPNPPALVVLGLDRTSSNDQAYADQVRKARQWLATQPADTSVAVLQIDGKSDDSSVVDFFWHAQPSVKIGTPKACDEGCRTHSIYEQTCVKSLDRALRKREEEVVAHHDALRKQHLSDRARAFDQHFTRLEGIPRANQTSVIGFWRKLADFPPLRASTQVQVIVLSDLIDTHLEIHRFLAAQSANVACEKSSPIPTFKRVQIALLQNRNDPEISTVGRTWQRALSCAGADVTLARWTPALDIGDYLGHLRGTPATPSVAMHVANR
jgi:hypothetical protein